MFKCLIVVSLLIASLAFAAVEKKRIYVCEEGYDPPCRLVNATKPDVEKTDWEELIAASRAYRSGVETPILRDDFGPIAGCANSHGQSGCCKIIQQTANNKVYIECG